ncbi:phage scaffolding protein [Anaerococcus sp. AGMB00486]|uniref:Scaffolding protein n=2 Tax=Anaerococcus TaxID=165779 RepID=A0A6N7VD85_9FIRM|nr:MULTISPECIES: phage scaffolding protein [Anaerococcus]MSS77176.1 scaffolding protein [Anaerococcus porci]MSS77385.1 scaffolding protein [Anaerococcus porci]NVF10814.1 phage scaffolding protein [Anaerococcus faecalis]
MKTEELKEIGLNDEQIAAVFKLRGKEVEDYNQLKNNFETLKTENENFKNQVASANEQIEAFKDMDIESIKASAEEYKNKYEQAQIKAKEDMDNITLNNAIDLGLVNAGSRNLKAAKALLDIDSLKDSKNLNDDLKAQIEGLKESDSYLFKTEEEPKQRSMGKSGSIGEKELKDMTYEEMLEANKKGIL